MRRQKLSTVNLGNLLVILGLGGLGASFWLPYGTAERVHRLERRASKFASQMLKVVAAGQEIAWRDGATQRGFARTVNSQLGLDDPSGSIYIRVRETPRRLAGAAWWFEGKHYLYMVTATPAGHLGMDNQPIERPGVKGEPADAKPGLGDDPAAEPTRSIEVYAWPKDTAQGAMTVFFYCTNSAGAFQRNLAKRYIGALSFPDAGDGYPHHPSPNSKIYYGYDDERWQLIEQ